MDQARSATELTARGVRRRWTHRLMVITVAVGCASCVPVDGEAPVADAEPVLRLVEAYDRAISRKDGEWISSLLAENYVYFQSTGGMRDRSSVLGMVTSPDYRVESRSREDITVRITGCTAVVESRWRGTGTFKGERFVDDQRCGLVFVTLHGAWRLVAEHCTQIR